MCVCVQGVVLSLVNALWWVLSGGPLLSLQLLLTRSVLLRTKTKRSILMYCFCKAVCVLTIDMFYLSLCLFVCLFVCVVTDLRI